LSRTLTGRIRSLLVKIYTEDSLKRELQGICSRPRLNHTSNTPNTSNEDDDDES
jgi:hypothetical protein